MSEPKVLLEWTTPTPSGAVFKSRLILRDDGDRRLERWSPWGSGGDWVDLPQPTDDCLDVYDAMAGELSSLRASLSRVTAERDEAEAHLRQVERLRLFVDAYEGRVFDKEVMRSILDTAARVAARKGA